jgi:hypothetical protein
MPTGDAGKHSDADRFVDEGLGIDRSAAAIRLRIPASSAITPPKPYSDAVFSDASRAPATAPCCRLRTLRARPPRESKHVNIPSSSAPSTAQIAARGDLRDDGLARAKRDFMRGAIGTRHSKREHKVRDPYHHQREKRDPGVRQFLGFVRLRFITEVGAVTFAFRLAARMRLSI